MIQSVIDNLTRKIELTQEEIDLFCSKLTHKKIKKNKLIHLEGSIMHHFYFVSSGLLRLYTSSKNFDEQTFEFCYENTWIADLHSLQEHQPSKINIETLEDCEIYTLHTSDVIVLHELIPALEKFSRKHAEERYIEAMLRIQHLYHPNLTALERFESFCQYYPMLQHRISTQHLASFLGVVPETISRLKRQYSIQK